MHRWLVRGAGSLLLVGGAVAGLAAAATSVDKTSAEKTTAGKAPPVAVVKQAPLRYGVFRFTSYPAAWTQAQKSNRPILVFVTSQRCPHCTRMIGETYKKSTVRGFVEESFETVLVDSAEQPQLTATMRVRILPTTLVVGTDNKVMDIIEGYVDAPAFARRLQTTLATHEETQKR